MCAALHPARRVVPGASDDLIAVRKAKAPKAVAKHVTELPVLPNYEYELPVASEGKQSTNQLSADELKVRLGACGQQRNCCWALFAACWCTSYAQVGGTIDALLVSVNSCAYCTSTA
jgi:hypothetical protein